MNAENKTTDEQREEKRPKPHTFVRIWHALWRRRHWRKISDRARVNWAEKLTAFITFAILVVGAIQARIYWRQAQLMKASLDQTERSIILNMGQLGIANRNSKTAEDTLGEIKKGGRDTHTLAVAAGTQATAAQTTAGAAQSAAVTAKDALHISERAYVTQGPPEIDTAKSMIGIPIVNSGRIPSGKVEVVGYEVTFNPDKMTEGFTPFKDVVERHKGVTDFASIPPGTPPTLSIGFPIPKMSKDRLNNGSQLIVIVGTITYNDGFPNSPMQLSLFCTQTLYQTVAKQVYLSPCNAASELPKFEALDWTGLTQ